jgi:hypothetical protein
MCFETEKAPKDWAKGMIFPIHKEGDKRNPDNYRGISLLSIVGKVYTAILHARLSSWCEREGIIVEEQGGFRPGRGCVEQLYTLISVLTNRVGKKTYCCFIDLRKAYDRVWRKELWNRVWREGVRGKMWRVLRNLYSGTQNCVIVGGEKTDFFEVEEGVRQGCVLSPTLFSIYLNGVVREIYENGSGIDVCGKKLAILLYADDIVLIANSAEELQRNMEIMTDWGRKWKCTFNKKKSKVVVFGSKNKKERRWLLGGGEIEQVNKYKYLGIDMKGNLTWGDYKKRQLEKAEERLNFVGAMGLIVGCAR